jgi:hypothetical protein
MPVMLPRRACRRLSVLKARPILRTLLANSRALDAAQSP